MYVKSEGCEDRFKTAGTCGIAYIKVQRVERSLKNRGHNVVVVDGTTGMPKCSLSLQLVPTRLLDYLVIPKTK